MPKSTRATDPVKNNPTTLPAQPSPAVVFMTAGRSAAQRIIATTLCCPVHPASPLTFCFPNPSISRQPKNLASRVSHLPRRADAETPPLRVSQTVNHNSPRTTAFLSRVSAVLMALLYERSLTRYMRNFNIASVCVASLVSVYG